MEIGQNTFFTYCCMNRNLVYKSAHENEVAFVTVATLSSKQSLLGLIGINQYQYKDNNSAFKPRLYLIYGD